MISVIIATYNGQAVLPKTLAALCLINIPSQGVEFVFVDNASTDNSAEILAEYTDKLPLTILHEARQGKAFAIHTGIENAKGDLIIFSDDDVIPNVNWLIAFDKTAENNVDYSVFLGQIRPFWLKSAPEWLAKLTDEGKMGGCTSLTLKSGSSDYNYAKGANFAVRKKVLDTISFREDLWIAGENQVGGEDTDFVKKASLAGFNIWFESDACLQHIIRPNEMSLSGIWKRYFRIGRSMSAVNSEAAFNGSKIFGYPRWFLVDSLKQCIKLIFLSLKFERYAAALTFINLAVSYGQQYQLNLMNKKPHTSVKG